MAQPLGTPYSQFFDNNGDPLAGGKIYTYTAGTNTPKDSYTDSEGATPAANPVILDAAGRAVIWLSGSYKIVVKDADDVTIYTTDNITAVSAAGDMSASVYDAANIIEQLVGLTAVQTLTNKSLTSPTLTGTPVAPTAADLTNTTQIATTAFVMGAIGYKVGSTTRDITTATGTQAITGVGFKPKAVILMAAVANEPYCSVGFSDGSSNIALESNSDGSTATDHNVNTGAAIIIRVSGGNAYTGTISAFGSDGFTISWTKTGTPTGTATIGYLALR